MIGSAFTLFFLAVLIGGALTVYATVRPAWRRVLAALRQEPLLDPSFSQIDSPPSVRQRTEPLLRPVVISICRV